MQRIGIAALTLIVSCAGGPAGVTGKSVQEAYSGETGIKAIVLQDAASPLSQQKRIPVISAPEVFAVYVPSHVDIDRDMMVGEHWLFVKLRDSTWFTDREREPEPVADGVMSNESVRRIAPAVHGLREMVVPYGR